MPLKSARLDELPVCRSLARGRGSLVVSSSSFFFPMEGKRSRKQEWRMCRSGARGRGLPFGVQRINSKGPDLLEVSILVGCVCFFLCGQ